MRDPASPAWLNAAEIEISVGTSGVSIPDRRRIDSDVRAFLREPSTPWIVFDREGRPPSQLAVGEVLTGPRKTLLSDYDFFPNTSVVDGASSYGKVVEPSSLAVASDLESEAAPSPAGQGIGMSEDDAIPKIGPSRRLIGAAAAAVALASMLAIGSLALPSGSHDSSNAAVPAEIPPPGLDVRAPVAAPGPASVAPPTVAAAPAAAAPHGESAAKGGPKKGPYGRLSIAGDARAKDVFMDGKRMLGRGARTFTVMCGAHTIAVGVRSDAHAMDVPCNAELVVGR